MNEPLKIDAAAGQSQRAQINPYQAAGVVECHRNGRIADAATFPDFALIVKIQFPAAGVLENAAIGQKLEDAVGHIVERSVAAAVTVVAQTAVAVLLGRGPR